MNYKIDETISSFVVTRCEVFDFIVCYDVQKTYRLAMQPIQVQHGTFFYDYLKKFWIRDWADLDIVVAMECERNAL